MNSNAITCEHIFVRPTITFKDRWTDSKEEADIWVANYLKDGAFFSKAFKENSCLGKYRVTAHFIKG
jgi:hypothetical protein